MLPLTLLVPLACADATGPDGGPCPVVAGRVTTRVPLSLAPGQMCTLAASDADAVDIEPGSASAQYLVVVQSGVRTPGATTRLRLSARARNVAAARVPALVVPTRTISIEGQRLEAASQTELDFRENARRALEGATPLRVGPRRGAPAGTATATATRPRAAPPSVGDTVVFHNAVDPDLNVDCAGIHDVTAVVRAVGSNFAAVEDLDGAGPVPAGAYQRVVESLELLVLPVVTAYFGEPADLDENGIVWVLFTPVVNRVTSRNSTTRVSGFFSPTDLADPESCGASNGGELLYVLAADPGGRFSDPVPVSFATTRAIGVATHELAHLISAEQRTVLSGGGFGDLEATWLSEGLAHSAETFVGMFLAAHRPGGNYGFLELAAQAKTFRTYHFPNFRRAAYYLSDPHGTPALGDDRGRDPAGLPSLAMRGFGWLLLRWFADQYATGAGGILGGPREEAIFRDLSGGGETRSRGVENLERVAATLGAPSEWEALLAAWALSPLADDLPGEVPAATQVTSLGLRDLFAALNRELEGEEPFERPFPLLTTEFGLAADIDVRVDFELNASTGRYFVLESDGPHPAIRIALSTQAGLGVPPSAGVRFVVLRTR
ncbi:hypothetical protein [Candidatus Palauibacter sp.]|uniref:hypothetical protein n=1 Tax=Candidatus Palauibacter sp. TaxID=3101350 RepID=UPI003B5BCD5A